MSPAQKPVVVTPRPDPVRIKPIPGRRHNVRKVLWKAALALLIAAPLVFMLAALLYRVGLTDLRFSFGFLTRKLGVWLLFGSILAGLGSLALGWFIQPRSRTAMGIGALAVAVGVAGLVWGASVQRTAGSLPFIHDISTDTQNPPVFEGRILTERGDGSNPLNYVGKRDSRENELVSVLQTRSYPDINPLVSNRSPEDAQARARAVAESLGWEVVDEAPGRIEATATTFWYGFKDDIAIRIRPGSGGGSVVDLRSVSRVGGSDLGANAARIRAFRERF